MLSFEKEEQQYEPMISRNRISEFASIYKKAEISKIGEISKVAQLMHQQRYTMQWQMRQWRNFRIVEISEVTLLMHVEDLPVVEIWRCGEFANTFQ